MNFLLKYGTENEIPRELNEGCLYICTDTGSCYVDFKINNLVKRVKLSAEYADKLKYLSSGGQTLEINPQEILTDGNYSDKIGTASKNNDGLMSNEDKNKLDGIDAGAAAQQVWYGETDANAEAVMKNITTSDPENHPFVFKVGNVLNVKFNKGCRVPLIRFIIDNLETKGVQSNEDNGALYSQIKENEVVTFIYTGEVFKIINPLPQKHGQANIPSNEYTTGDFNEYTTAGWYYGEDILTVSNNPTDLTQSSSYTLEVQTTFGHQNVSYNTVVQLLHITNYYGFYTRTYDGEKWTDWRIVGSGSRSVPKMLQLTLKASNWIQSFDRDEYVQDLIVEGVSEDRHKELISWGGLNDENDYKIIDYGIYAQTQSENMITFAATLNRPTENIDILVMIESIDGNNNSSNSGGGTAASIQQIETKLPQNSWTKSTIDFIDNDFYENTITVSSVSADYGKQQIVWYPQTFNDLKKAYPKNVQCLIQEEGQLTFIADGIPDVDINIYVNIQEVR